MPWDTSDAERKDVRLAAAVADMGEPMRKATDIIAAGIVDNFASESAAGEAWEPLAESTLEDRARKGFPPGPILRRTGELKAAASAYRASDGESAEVGPDGCDYAKFHVSLEPRSKIPLRDFLAMPDERLDEIETAILAHLDSVES